MQSSGTAAASGATSFSRSRVLAFDGVRGLMLGLVIAHHAGYNHVVDGRVALDMFFTLSGFLITSILLRERARSERIGLGGFYLRRARRLLPALFLMLAGTLAVGHLFERAEHLRGAEDALPFILLYAANWHGITEGVAALGPFAHTWSLSVEEQFYLLWPLVVVLVAVKLRRTALLVPLCLVGSGLALVARIRVVEDFSSFERLYTGTDVVADHLLMGCALGVLLSTGGEAAATRIRAIARRLLPVALLVWAYAAFVENWALREWNPTLRFPVTQTVIALASTVVIAHLYLEQDSAVSRVLSWRPLVGAGVVSYGMYLWHVPVFLAIRNFIDQPNRGVVLLVGVPLTLAIAAGSYHLLERPILEGRMPLGLRRTPTVAPVALPANPTAVVDDGELPPRFL